MGALLARYMPHRCPAFNHVTGATNLLPIEQVVPDQLNASPLLVREAARPMEAIDSIRIVQVDGPGGGTLDAPVTGAAEACEQPPFPRRSISAKGAPEPLRPSCGRHQEIS